MELYIRMAEPEDVLGMLEIYSPFVKNSAVTFEVLPPPEEEFQTRVEAVLREAPWLVCMSGSTVAGYAYAGSHRKRAAYQYTRELSVYVRPDFQRRGIASGLYATLIEILNLQGYSNALIGITLPNPSSVGFHEKMGFRPVGVYHRVGVKLGQFYDVGWWEMSLSDQVPERILPPEAIDSGQLESAFAIGMNCLRA